MEGKHVNWDSINVSINGKVIQCVPYSTGAREHYCYKCEDSKLFEFKQNIFGCDKCKSTFKITGTAYQGSF
jgi:ribosomal protein L37AE/L43A